MCTNTENVVKILDLDNITLLGFKICLSEIENALAEVATILIRVSKKEQGV